MIGQAISNYRVIEKLGAGGMGEVYRARDAKLNRDVAIKILPEAFAQEEERVARFKREAQVLASLNHPNIAAIYGLEESNGELALVMELVEGPTLADRIAAGPIPLDDALPIARQIAEGLEAAHERGIIHRDLKPANVKVTPDGTVKVLDFGLAKVFEGDSQATDLSHSPTLIKGTQAGMILGTAAYMSPEQAKGKAVDRRADIWALGCVLFEMLSGQQTFSGETLTDTLAAVVRAEPDWGALPAATPGAIRRLLQRCLTKDPKQRLRDIGEARIVLGEPYAEVVNGNTAVAVPAPAQPAWKRLLPWTLVVLLAAGLAVIYVSRAPKAQSLLRSSINLPTGFSLDRNNSSLALSPDGQRLVFAAAGDDGKGQQLWLRSLDSLTIQLLAGTSGATYPLWSPDGRYVGFFADQRLKKTEISSGTVQILCDAVDGRGASWSRKDVIVFAPQPFGPLFEVSAAGGTPVQVTSVESTDVTHRNPHFLPDGERLLFYSGRTATNEEENGIYSLDLDTKKVALVARENSEGIYVEPGYLVFVRNGNLMAQSFDARRLSLAGQAVPIAERVLYNPDRFTGGYSLSDTGLLLFDSGSGVMKSQLTWFEVGGKKLGTVAEPAAFLSISISPDGKRALAHVGTAPESLWMYDLNRGIARRFTSGSETFFTPAWSPDGRLVVYTGSNRYLYLQASDAISEVQKLQTGQITTIPGSWSPDGRMVVFTSQTSQGGDLWIQSMEGDKKPYAFLVTPASEIEGAISPDGRWIAFASDETGRYELYVTSFPSPGGKRQISSDGADAPQWLNAGRQLAYINAERKLVIVDVDARGQQFEIGQYQVLFGGKPLPALPHDPSGWDVPVYLTSDGKRILLPVPLETDSSRPLTLVTNWTTALKK
jgi:eukaryotic-like serine/threonine-protein kinase